MNKKIIFLTEMGFSGPIPRTHDNMRVEFAQMCALGAMHWPMLSMDTVTDHYDYAILLIGKTNSFRDQIFNIDVVSKARRFADKVYFMQEGPSWIFQDMPLQHQFYHFNILASVDGILTENKTDISYFKGLNPTIPITDIPSLMIEDSVQSLPTVERNGVVIGGTFCRWYGGFDSYIAAMDFEQPIYAPSMGRKKPEEDLIENLSFLPYMNWVQWIYKLNEFKYAIHLMPTFAAGTFAMNCSYLGIPCIGYDEVDTQRSLHPSLSIESGNLELARKLAKLLKDDKDFYNECSNQTKQLYAEHHSENKFIEHMKKVFI
jgi:hypothetical protein